jgi:glutaryl-CoA dehydrogenase
MVRARRVPVEVFPELGALGLLGMHLSGYGCAGASAVMYGLAIMELEAGDSGFRSAVSVPGLAGDVPDLEVRLRGAEAAVAAPHGRGRAIGCFGLTEPDFGSNPAGMRTLARRDGRDWVLSGTKMWITNGGIADVAVVWARAEEGIRGFLVPKGTPGFTTRDVERKLSLRASVTSELILDECRLPDDAVLPDAAGLRGPLSCLDEARYGIAWGAMGAARSCFETALEYSKTRVQFGRPIGGFQLTQEKLANMLVELTKGAPAGAPPRRMKDEGRLRPEQVSLAKLNNVREALRIAREARTILGRERRDPRVPRDPAHEQPGVRADLRGHQRDPHADPRPRADGPPRVRFVSPFERRPRSPKRGITSASRCPAGSPPSRSTAHRR